MCTDYRSLQGMDSMYKVGEGVHLQKSLALAFTVLPESGAACQLLLTCLHEVSKGDLSLEVAPSEFYPQPLHPLPPLWRSQTFGARVGESGASGTEFEKQNSRAYGSHSSLPGVGVSQHGHADRG